MYCPKNTPRRESKKEGMGATSTKSAIDGSSQPFWSLPFAINFQRWWTWNCNNCSDGFGLALFSSLAILICNFWTGIVYLVSLNGRRV